VAPGSGVERLSALTRIVTVMSNGDGVSSSDADASTGAAGAPGPGGAGGGSPVTQGLTASDPLVVGGYTLLGRWGRSGWGREYLAQSAAGALVTVRMIDQRGLGDPVVRSGLVGVMRAARRTAGLSCVARILEVQVDGEVPHVVTEFVEGPSLRQVVAHQGAQVGDGLEWIAVQSLVALSALHDVGVVHRGLTPDCVVIGADGLRMVDVGLSRVGVAAGAAVDPRDDSRLYTAPEVSRGQVGDAAADLFAWAATITFAATGGPPFDMARVQDGSRGLDAAEFDVTGVRLPLVGLLRSYLAQQAGQRPTAAAAYQRLVQPQPTLHPAGVPQGARPGEDVPVAPTPPDPSSPPLPTPAGRGERPTTPVGQADPPAPDPALDPSPAGTWPGPGRSVRRLLAWVTEFLGRAGGRRAATALAVVAVCLVGVVVAGYLVVGGHRQPLAGATGRGVAPPCPRASPGALSSLVPDPVEGCYGYADSGSGFGRDPRTTAVQAAIFAQNLPVGPGDLTVIWLGSLTCPAYLRDGSCADGRV
jgi:hypothetical protein